jgi:DNA end-binding protein Ku
LNRLCSIQGDDIVAARPIWRGQIRLALVSIPVELYSATKSGATISFHQVHEPTGKRIKYEKVVPGVGPVDRDEIVKGYEVSKGHYVLLDPEEIESVKLESRKTLDLVQFVDNHDIDPMYYEKPYFVVPADDLAEEAFVVLRDALRSSKKIGVGQLAMRGQEYVVALKPCGRGMLLETLRYAEEVNKAQSYFREIGDAEPDPDLLDMASMLIERKTGKFDPGEFHNRYVDALRDLIEEKQRKKGEKVIQDPDDGAPPKGSNVVDLMAALKRSLGEDKGGKAANENKGAAKKPAAKKPAPRHAPKKAPAKKTAAGGRKR